MARSFSCRPSDLLAVEDPHDAFRLDRSVWIFGSALKGELESVEGKTSKEVSRKQDRILQRWIPQIASDKKKFQDPPKEKLV